MYDSDLRRFLSPDNYVQDPTNTQNYNRYQYGYNNPLKYSDPSGEFFFLAAIIIGAIIGGASYAVNAAITGKWSWGGFFKAIVMGGVSGAISFGIGSWTASIKGVLSTVVNISAHAVASGAQSLVQGGKFLAGALAGGISAGIAKGVGAITSAAKRMSTFVKSAITIASGGVSGGIGSVLGGGKFMDGFRQGVITSGLNHVAHLVEKGLNQHQQKQSSTITLKFDGERIYIVKNGKEIASYPAVSGRPGKDGMFDYSIDRQQMKNIGPIPEGNYLIDSDNTQRWADLSFSQKTAAIFNLGQFPGGTIAWGSERVDITPLNTTNVYGRFGFTIHGGAVPGSAGCIDLTTYDKAFFSLIRNHGLIKLTVDY